MTPSYAKSPSLFVQADVLTSMPSAEVGCQTGFAISCTTLFRLNEVIEKHTGILTNNAISNSVNDSNSLSFETLQQLPKKFKYYTGLSVLQFLHLFNSLGDCVNNIRYYTKAATSAKRRRKKNTSQCKLDAKDQLLLTLIRLKCNLDVQDLAFRFNVSTATVSRIVITWIQLLYVKFKSLAAYMFPTREKIRRHLPSCFKGYKNLRIIIDCFEIFAESPRNFSEQGNMYSHYKHHTTYKVLLGIAPTGAVTFVSEAYEGCISDKDIVVKSGLVDHLVPGDLVLADRGFTIREHLQRYGVNINIPPFLGKRSKFTAPEELETKRIARVRIHVERCIERLRKYKIIKNVLKGSLRPCISQIVFIIGCLVNYQKPIVS